MKMSVVRMIFCVFLEGCIPPSSYISPCCLSQTWAPGSLWWELFQHTAGKHLTWARCRALLLPSTEGHIEVTPRRSSALHCSQLVLWNCNLRKDCTCQWTAPASSTYMSRKSPGHLNRLFGPFYEIYCYLSWYMLQKWMLNSGEWFSSHLEAIKFISLKNTWLGAGEMPT